MLRWAILGTGAAAGLAATAMRAAGHDLAAVASDALTRAHRFAANHGVRRARAGYAAVLDADDVDAVFVALPNDLHEEWSLAACAAGKHVLVAAPLAPDAAAAGRMAAGSAAAGRLLVHAVAWRLHPRFVAALDLVWAGGIGDVRLITATAGSRVLDPRSFRTRVDRGGGALLDAGVHATAAVRWLAGAEPVQVGAVQTHWSTGVDGTTAAVLAFPTGTVATVQASFDAGAHDHVEIVGTEGALRLPGAFTAGSGEAVALVRNGAAVGTWRADPFERLVRAFADAVSGDAARVNESGLASVDDAVATMAVLDRIRAAAA